MRALAKLEPRPGAVGIIDAPEPLPAEMEVVIKVLAAGICGTDLSILEWSEEIVDIYKPPLPLIMGHEFVGIVQDTGGRTRAFRDGTMVTANPMYFCGKCVYCQEGRHSICDNRPMLGLELPGAFAEYVKVRAPNVVEIPAGVPTEVAALSEPLSVAVHSTEQVPPKGYAVVVGCGGIGLATVVVLKTIGLDGCIVMGLATDMERLEIAKELGAEIVIVDKQDPVEFVREATQGRNADVVYETSGSYNAVQLALEVARKGGKIALVGLPHQRVDLPISKIATMEKELIGVRAYCATTWKKSTRLLSSCANDLRKIVTHTLPLKDGRTAFEIAARREGIKVLLIP